LRKSRHKSVPKGFPGLSAIYLCVICNRNCTRRSVSESEYGVILNRSFRQYVCGRLDWEKAANQLSRIEPSWCKNCVVSGVSFMRSLELRTQTQSKKKHFYDLLILSLLKLNLKLLSCNPMKYNKTVPGWNFFDYTY